MAPPSCLPDWRAFNTFVLDEARASALATLPELDPETREALEALSLDALPVVAFSETLVRTFAARRGSRCSACSTASCRTRAISRLRNSRGSVSCGRHLDQLRHAYRARVPRARGPAERLRESPRLRRLVGRCALYKIHGSAKDAASLVDTVTQKLRGLPDEVRTTSRRSSATRISSSSASPAPTSRFPTTTSASARRCPSGAGLVAAPGQTGPGGGRGGRRGRRGRGSGRPRDAARFFGELGLAVEPEAAAADGQAQADARARQAVSEWLRAPELGPRTCAVYLARLLSLTGRVLHAQRFARRSAPLVGDGRGRGRCCTRSRSTQSATGRSPSPELPAPELGARDGRGARIRPSRARGRVAPARGLRAAEPDGPTTRGSLWTRRSSTPKARMLADVVALIELAVREPRHAAGAHRDDVLARLEIARRYAPAAERATCCSRSSSQQPRPTSTGRVRLRAGRARSRRELLAGQRGLPWRARDGVRCCRGRRPPGRPGRGRRRSSKRSSGLRSRRATAGWRISSLAHVPAAGLVPRWTRKGARGVRRAARVGLAGRADPLS